MSLGWNEARTIGHFGEANAHAAMIVSNRFANIRELPDRVNGLVQPDWGAIQISFGDIVWRSVEVKATRGGAIGIKEKHLNCYAASGAQFVFVDLSALDVVATTDTAWPLAMTARCYYASSVDEIRRNGTRVQYDNGWGVRIPLESCERLLPSESVVESNERERIRHLSELVGPVRFDGEHWKLWHECFKPAAVDHLLRHASLVEPHASA